MTPVPLLDVNRLDAHDRFLHLTNQKFDVVECCKNLIEQRPFGDHPFYIFCHPRTEDDGVNKRFIWQPRITKPKAQTNSMLFKAKPGSDEIMIVWMLPPREMWPEYALGNVCGNKLIAESILAFETNREALEAPMEDDPSPFRAQEILFEYYPQLFKRETLPDHMKAIYDAKRSSKAALSKEKS